MKNIIILLTFLWAITSYAVAPYGIKGQNQTGTLYSNVHQFPNNQVTNLGGINALVETGNTNILSNPSFEHSTFSTSWTNSAGTFTQETSVLIDGKASAKLVLSAQTMSLTQSSTLYAAQFADGVQGLAMVRIKSDIALSVCSIQAGTVSTTNCVTTATDSKWGLYKIPFILGATSNGISIASTGSVSGTVYIDDAFVGAVDLKQDINVCRSANCETEFSAKVAAGGTISAENYDFLSSVTGAAIIKTATFSSNVFTVAPNCTVSSLSGSYRFTNITVSSNTTASIGVYRADSVALVDEGFNITCSKTGVDFTNAMAIRFGNVYSSQCGANCVDTFSAKISTTPTASGLNVSGWITSVAKSGTNNLIKNLTIPSGIFTVIPNCTCTADATATAADISCKFNPAGSTITSLVFNTSNNGVAEDRAIIVSCQKQGADFVATRTIQGSFNNVITTPNVSKPQLYSAYITSTGTITSEFGDFISGNCAVSGTSIYTCTLNAGKFATAPVCVVAALVFGHFNYGSMQSTTTSAVVYRINNYTGTAQARDAMLICHGDL